jgi:transcriptional regulator with XRE-family HTH domain
MTDAARSAFPPARAGVDRAELAAFLRACRERLRPADAGLPAGRRRRTPGLRREEVARLAAMSVDYYVRLEQARGPRPSRELLASLARALRLSGDEHDHLFHLAGEAPPRSYQASRHVSPAMLMLLDRLEDTPAVVSNARGDILAWNPMAAALITDFSAMPPQERNYAWLHFASDAVHRRFTPADWDRLSRAHVAHLRALAAQQPDDTDLVELIGRLRARSQRFAALWAQHDVAVRRECRKRIQHPVVGPLEVETEVLHSPEHDQRLIIYRAAPGSSSEQALALLRVVGLQDATTG